MQKTLRSGMFGMALSAAVLTTLWLPRGADATAAIAISHSAALGFGQIVATPAAGTVTVTPDGIRFTAGGALMGSGSSVSRATFSVSGEPGTSYSITLPDSASLSNGWSFMTVDSFASSPSGSGVLGTGGTQAVSVGATLHVAAFQPPGRYTGTYSVTVTYE